MPRRLSLEDRIRALAKEDKATQNRNYNFKVHGKRLVYSERSLFLFTDKNRFRKLVVWIAESRAFEAVILLAILVNSVFLGMSDFRYADSTNTLQPGSWRNTMILNAEAVFTAIFATEAVMKIIGMGFVVSKGSYLRDPWNMLDFTVVLAAVLSTIPAVPNISVLRSFRILRPLRSLTMLPGMRILVMSLLHSLPALCNVVFLVLFMFTVFGILGVQLLSGAQHARCRLTELPVRFIGDIGAGPCAFPYSDECQSLIMAHGVAPETGIAKSVVNNALGMKVSYLINTTLLERCMAGDNDAGTSKASSVWREPKDCFWPMDMTDSLLCSLGGAGDHSCGIGRWCGSNFDAYGNERFIDDQVQRSATFIPSLNFGYTSFDSIFRAMLTIFQSITQEGWADIMYLVMDTYNPVFGALFMVALIIFGSFFLLNLTLSVIWSSFEESQEQEKAKKEYLFRKKFNLDSVDPEEKQFDMGHNVLAAFGFNAFQLKKLNIPGFGGSANVSKSVPGGHDSHNGDEGGVVEEPQALSDLVPPHEPAPGQDSDSDSDKYSDNGEEMIDQPRPALAPRRSSGSFRCSSRSISQMQEALGSPHSVLSRLSARSGEGHLSARLPRSARSFLAASAGSHSVVPAMPASFHASLFRAPSSDPFDVNQLSDADIAERLTARIASGGNLRETFGLHHHVPVAGYVGVDGEELLPVPEGVTPVEEDVSRDVSSQVATGDKCEEEVVSPTSPDSLHGGATSLKSRMMAPLRSVQRIRSFSYSIVTSTWFNTIVGVLILANTVVLACDHYPIQPATATNLEILNFALTTFFFVDMVLKLAGMGWCEYFKDRMNVFDCIIVLASVVELTISPPSFLTPASDVPKSGGLSALRTFRLFRVVRFARNWSSLRVLLEILAKTCKDISNFALLLVLLIYIGALLGMQLFANRLCFDDVTNLKLITTDNLFCRPRSNFDSLPAAVMTVFQVLTTENWNVVMYDGWRAMGWFGVLYFVMLIIIGNFIALNLFIAILLGNFEGVEELLNTEKQSIMSVAAASRLFRIPQLMSKFHSGLQSIKTSRFQRSSAAVSDAIVSSPHHDERAMSLAERIKTESSLVMPGPGRRAYSRLAEVRTKSKAPVSAMVAAESRQHLPSVTEDDAGDTDSPARPITPGPLAVLAESEHVDGDHDDDVSPVDEAVIGRGLSDKTLSTTSRASPFPVPVSVASRRVSCNLPGSIESPDEIGRAKAPGELLATASPSAAPVDCEPQCADLVVDTYRTQPDLHREASTEPRDRRDSKFGNRVLPIDTTTGNRNEANRSEQVVAVDPKPGYRGARFAATSHGSDVGKLSKEKLSSQQSIQSTMSSSSRNAELTGRSLCVFPLNSPIRIVCARITSSKSFENLILVMILLSSVALVLDNPLENPESALAKMLSVADVMFTVLFTVEFGLKVIARGFAFGPSAYLKSGWNVLDMAIVAISLAGSLSSGNSSLKSLRTLRALRALRPLRFISRFPGLRLSVNALFSSIPAILNVMLVAVMFVMIFAIVSVQYFKGALDACQGEDFDGLSDSVLRVLYDPVPFSALSGASLDFFNSTAYQTFPGTPTGRQVCTFIMQALPSADITWAATTVFSFNDIFSAMSTLFQISTTEGWVDLTYACVDARGPEQQPVRDYAIGWVFFFISFIIVGSFFIMNLFIGVIIENFNIMKKKLGKNALLTGRQVEWVQTRRLMLRMRPLKRRIIPSNPFRKAVYHFVHKNVFESFVMFCIVANTVTMAMPYFGAADAYLHALESINLAFVVVFTLEAVLKLLAFGARYWSDSWNIFDFVVVIGSLVGIVVQSGSSVKAGPVISVIRTFRIGRVFRLIKRAKALNLLFQTLLVSLPSMGNISALLFLLLFIYAVMGVQLFAPVMLQESLNSHANFQSFGRALLTLFRGTTGESWNYIMADLSIADPSCDPDLLSKPWSYRQQFCGFNTQEDCLPIPGCGNRGMAVVFYESFTLLITYVFMNLFVAVILEGFSIAEDEADAILSKEHLKMFQHVWVEFDGDGTGIMDRCHLNELLRQLPYPMGFKGAPGGAQPTLKDIRKRLQRMDVKLYQNKFVTFWDFATGLARVAFEDEACHHNERFDIPEATARSPRTRLMRKLQAQAGDAQYSLQCYFAANVIQTMYLNRKRRKEREAGRKPAINVKHRSMTSQTSMTHLGQKQSSKLLLTQLSGGIDPNPRKPVMLGAVASKSKRFLQSVKKNLLPVPHSASDDSSDSDNEVSAHSSKVAPVQ